MTEKDYTNSVGIIELDNNYIINGHLYNRNFSYTGMNFNQISTDFLCIAHSTDVTSSGTNVGIETQQTQIEYNGIVYFIKNNTQIYKYDTNNETISLIFENTTTYRPFSIVDIDSNYLYLITKSSSYRGSTTLSKLDLSTNTMSNISYYNQYTNYYVSILNVDSSYIYYFNDAGYNFGYYSNSNWCNGYQVYERIFKYDKSSKSSLVVTDLHSGEWRGGWWASSQCHLNFRVICSYKNSEYFIFGRELQSGGYFSMKISKLNDPTDIKNLNIRITNDAYINYWNIDNNIFIVFYNQYVNSTISKFYRYNFDTEELEIIYDDSNYLIKTILLSDDKTVLFLNELGSSHIYSYNEDTFTYENLTNLSHISHVGIDYLNRIWYITTTDEIHCIDVADPVDVSVTWEKPVYTWSGYNINSYFIFEAKTMINKYAHGFYEFKLSSNAVFTDNNSDTMALNYNVDEPIRIDFTIIGQESVNVNIKFNKVWSK